MDDNCKEYSNKEQTSNHSKNTEDKNCNACSPFSICGTCVGFTLIKNDYQFIDILFNVEKSFSEYKSAYFDEFVSKIWQPPKLG
jgi:hypothetical protein